MIEKQFFHGLIKRAAEAEDLANKSENYDMKMAQLTTALVLRHVADALYGAGIEEPIGLARKHFGIDQDYEDSTELPAFLRPQAE